MDRTELQNHINDVIEEYKDDMDNDGYDYADWTVDPKDYELICSFVAALPKDLPWPRPWIDEDDLCIGWGYEDQSWLTVTALPNGQLRWDCEIYQNLTEDPKDFCGSFPLSKGIPQQVLDLIQCIGTR